MGALRERRLNALASRYRLDTPVYITRPKMPDLGAYVRLLEGIWERRWLTNRGLLHEELERRLAAHLGIEHLSLACNGTLALMLALRSLGLDRGEVITTPFTFPATVHAIRWNGLHPVFCDIEEDTCTIDPARIPALIGPETKVILGVHVYGVPCRVREIQSIAEDRNLSVVYDAAHAFGVQLQGRSVLDYGDMSVLSFHATKPFSTIEGGAIACRSPEAKCRIDLLRNFGIANEEQVLETGINAKMNELQAAFGLLQLDLIEQETADRARLHALYRERLKDIPGIRLLPELPGVRPSCSHLPVLVDPEAFGLGRDGLYEVLKRCNIHPRKYFFPLCSRHHFYSGYPSAAPGRLPNAERAASQVLCLPLYGELPPEVVETTCTILGEVHEACHRNPGTAASPLGR